MRFIGFGLVVSFIVIGCFTAQTLPKSMIETQHIIAEEPRTPVSSPTGIPKPTKRSFFNSLAYGVPGMEDVQVHNVEYASFEGKPLTVDIYYPPDGMDEAPFPSVIFVFGYKTSAIDLRNFYQYESWGRLVAAEGIVGIAYDTERPNVDLETLIAFLQEHAAEFKIDPERIGLWASSSNVPTAMSYVMQEGEDIAKFAVLYYGHMLSPDNYLREEINAQCAQRGCYSKELKDIQQIRSDLPLFIVRAGRDVLPHVNESIDHFMANFADEAIPITYIEYKDGLHGFDVEQRTDQSAEIIEKTIKFMKLHLGID